MSTSDFTIRKPASAQNMPQTKMGSTSDFASTFEGSACSTFNYIVCFTYGERLRVSLLYLTISIHAFQNLQEPCHIWGANWWKINSSNLQSLCWNIWLKCSVSVNELICSSNLVLDRLIWSLDRSKRINLKLAEVRDQGWVLSLHDTTEKTHKK